MIANPDTYVAAAVGWFPPSFTTSKGHKKCDTSLNFRPCSKISAKATKDARYLLNKEQITRQGLVLQQMRGDVFPWP